MFANIIQYGDNKSGMCQRYRKLYKVGKEEGGNKGYVYIGEDGPFTRKMTAVQSHLVNFDRE